MVNGRVIIEQRKILKEAKEYLTNFTLREKTMVELMNDAMERMQVEWTG